MKSFKFFLLIITVFILTTITSPVLANDSTDNKNRLLAEAVGLIAGLGTTFAALPDLLLMLRNRSTKGMNPRMAAIMGSFQSLWLIYGLMIDAPAVIVWNAIAVVINGTTVATFYYFTR